MSAGALARDVKKLPTVSQGFQPELCSTSIALERVQHLSIKRSARGIRLLLDGPPGGGKTQYALWLARYLQRDVLLKRPSDLLSKYVGDSEKQIAASFRQAEQTGAVFIIDEADALLYDRAGAVRSWEQSQIAEFLQQIQDFTGILIACTNRVDAVDPALRRRFHLHVHFGPISSRKLLPALSHIFPDSEFSEADLNTLRHGPALMMSDLANAQEMLDVSLDLNGHSDNQEFASTEEIVAEIQRHASARDTSRKVGF